jgi:hypothetical protein
VVDAAEANDVMRVAKVWIGHDGPSDSAAPYLPVDELSIHFAFHL